LAPFLGAQTRNIKKSHITFFLKLKHELFIWNKEKQRSSSLLVKPALTKDLLLDHLGFSFKVVKKL
jgi:hypothetical protein